MANPTAQRRQTPTLTAYLAGRFAMYLLATLTALAALTYLIDAVDLLAKAGGQGLGTATILRMSAMKLPDLMQQLLPFAVLIATLVTLAQLNRTHELVALRASGLPARRIMVGPLLVVLLTGAAALTILNPLAATLLKRYDIWYSQTFPGSAKGLITKGGNIWLKQPDATTPGSTIFIYGQKVSELGTTITSATLLIITPEGSLQSRIETPHLTLTPGFWNLTSPTLINASGKGVKGVYPLTDNVRHAAPLGAGHPLGVSSSHSDSIIPSTINHQLPTQLTPQLIQNSFTQAKTLSVWELQQFITNLTATGFPSQAHATTYHRLLALPAFLVAMFLLGVPFALTFTRTRNLATVVGAGLGMGMGFYLFGNFTATLGMAGRLSPLLAAWAPTALATLLALALLVYLREE